MQVGDLVIVTLPKMPASLQPPIVGVLVEVENHTSHYYTEEHAVAKPFGKWWLVWSGDTGLEEYHEEWIEVISESR